MMFTISVYMLLAAVVCSAFSVGSLTIGVIVWTADWSDVGMWYKGAVLTCGALASAATVLETWRDCRIQEDEHVNSFTCAASVLGSATVIGYSVAHRTHPAGWIKLSEDYATEALEDWAARLHSNGAVSYI